MMLFMVVGVTGPVMAEQPLTIDVSRCVNIRSAIERLDCYDESAHQAQQTRSALETSDLSEPESDSVSDAPVTIIEQESVAAAVVIQSTPEVEQVPVTEQTVSDAPVTVVEPESLADAAVIQSAPVVEQVPVTEQTVSEAGRVTEENFGFPPEKRDDEKDLIELHSTIRELKEIRPLPISVLAALSALAGDNIGHFVKTCCILTDCVISFKTVFG